MGTHGGGVSATIAIHHDAARPTAAAAHLAESNLVARIDRKSHLSLAHCFDFRSNATIALFANQIW